MEIQCPRCGEFCKSKNSLDLHMVGEERCFKDGQSIADTLLHRIAIHKGQCEYLMRRFPGSKGDDRILYKWHQVIFQHSHYYDYDTSSFREKQSADFKSVKLHVSEQTLGRRRRELQEEDKEKYHKWIEVDDGNGDKRKEYLDEWLVPHECLLPSAQTQLKREILEQENHAYYSVN